MKTPEKLLIAASLEEFKEVFAAVLNEIFRDYQSTLSKPKEESFLSRQETCKQLRISLVTLHSWTLQGKLSAHKIAGSSKVYYAAKDVQNLIVSSRKTISHES